MRSINNRKGLQAFINTHFDYLAAKGFQLVDIEMPDSKSWAVSFDGRCRIRIEWNWHDGVFAYITKSGKQDRKFPHGYAVEILVYFLMGRQALEKYYAEADMGNDLKNIESYALFVQTHLDQIIDFVSSSQYDPRNPRLQQASQSLFDLQLQRIEEGRFQREDD